MPKIFSGEPSPVHPSLQPSLFKIYGALLVFFMVLGGWLAFDLQKGYVKVLADQSYRAMQRSQIIGQSFRTQVLATDYVLRDLLGRIQPQDIVYPDYDRNHAQRMTQLLKEKSDTVPDFFLVVFNKDCVFTATESGDHTGASSKPALCEARKAHVGPGPLVSYVSGAKSASGSSVLMLSRNFTSPTGEFQGGVMAVMELEKAQHWFDSLNLESGDSVALLDDAQILLARRPLLEKSMEEKATDLSIPGPLISTAAQSATLTRLDLDGSERIFGFSQIEGFPFFVAFGFDKSGVIEEWQHRAVELTTGFCILLLLALAVARSQWTMLHQREELRSSEEHFRMLAENMADLVWCTDAQMQFTYVNAADQRVRGFAREEVVGTHIMDNLTPQGKDIFATILQERRELELSSHHGLVLKYELPMNLKNGGEVWIEMTSVPIYDSHGRISGYQGVGRDVSKRRQHEANLLQSKQQLEEQLLEAAEETSALHELATHDALTGLYNRRFLDATLPREFARAKRDGDRLAVIMLDLDHFKLVNDNFSHAAGDKVLVTLADLMKAGARESDLICRYGGEEFAVIMPGMSVDQALERVESWRRQLEEMLVVYGDFKISITLSAGVAVFPDQGDSPGLLLALADQMLYKSKKEGRNRISVCSL
jgi:diguanylate cyclase (GGDEF)-like protein/PAS domain S-box-containing protein